MDAAPPEVPSQYRATGALMITSGALNLMVAAIWAISLIWVCCGVYWVVPMAFAVGEIVVGTLMAAGIRIRFGGIAAVVGAINGVLLFNVYAVTLQGVAFVLLLSQPVAEWIALEDRVDSLGP